MNTQIQAPLSSNTIDGGRRINSGFMPISIQSKGKNIFNFKTFQDNPETISFLERSYKPEEDLMIHILMEAKHDVNLLKNPVVRNRRQLENDLEAWFNKIDWEYPFSFINICNTLSLDPQATRKAIYASSTKPYHSNVRRHNVSAARIRSGRPSLKRYSIGGDK